MMLGENKKDFCFFFLDFDFANKNPRWIMMFFQVLEFEKEVASPEAYFYF